MMSCFLQHPLTHFLGYLDFQQTLLISFKVVSAFSESGRLSCILNRCRCHMHVYCIVDRPQQGLKDGIDDYISLRYYFFPWTSRQFFQAHEFPCQPQDLPDSPVVQSTVTPQWVPGSKLHPSMPLRRGLARRSSKTLLQQTTTVFA